MTERVIPITSSPRKTGTNLKTNIDVPDTNVGKWIPVSEKLPDKEEYLKDDGRFIVTDGNRRYQCIYDIYQGSFRTLVLFTNGGIERGWNFEEDKCVIAWQPLPEPYKGE